MNYILYRCSKSFYLIKKIGYYYIRHSQSITNNLKQISVLRMKFGFIFLKLLLEYSKNIKFEQDMSNAIFNVLNRKINMQKILSSFSTIEFNFYDNIINLYYKSKFIQKENKKLLEAYESIIKKNLNNKMSH